MINWLDWINWGGVNWTYPFVYIRGGIDPFQVKTETNLMEFANKHHKKSGTLTDSVHARTVRPLGLDRSMALLVLNTY